MVGQAHLIGEKGFLTQVIASKKPLSILLFGPPGCGKTTIAKLYAKAFDATFLSIHPVSQGIPELKKALQDLENTPLFKSHLVVFVDEIHRFNKAQQDVFLPYVESGKIILVGATTENPSFSINNALLSRVRSLPVHPLTNNDLKILIQRFLEAEKDLKLSPDCVDTLVDWSQQDARYLLNMLESLKLAPKDFEISKESLASWIQKKAPLYDRDGDQHYQLISALHKSIRGSDPDASLYWLCRMLNAGEDPLYILRRLIRITYEDIGLADPTCTDYALKAMQSYQMLGSPEGEIAIACCVIHLSLAPKSNASYEAYNNASDIAKKSSHLSPPKIIINGHTKLMKEQGFGDGYIYDHETLHGFSGQNYFPDSMNREIFYAPKERGFERELKKRLEFFQKLRNQK